MTGADAALPRNTGIPENRHNKRETLADEAYGLRNLENHGQRVQALCA